MTISEKKMQIVIDNYFKSECDVNTSIRQAFEKGFRIGIKKVPSVQPSSSCNHENDYISRQAAIREYQEVCKGIKCGECPFLIKVNTEKGSHLITDCKLEAFLHDLPSVQPKRKTGKWILVKEYIKIAAYKCSECGRSVWDDKGYDVVKDYPYCHCGADMRGEQDENR